MNKETNNKLKITIAALFAWAGTVVPASAWCFSYCLWCLFHRDAAWQLDVLGGIATLQFSIPLAIVFYVLVACGVATPFFNV